MPNSTAEGCGSIAALPAAIVASNAAVPQARCLEGTSECMQMPTRTVMAEQQPGSWQSRASSRLRERLRGHYVPGALDRDDLKACARRALR